MSRSSGKFIVRLPPSLHTRLKLDAAAQGRSLNEQCVKVLSQAPDASADLFAPSLSYLHNRFGEQLLGIAVFGSYARGEARAQSDVDLLIVLDPTVQIMRELYREWDQNGFRIEERPVEPQFVTFPEDPDSAAGIWAEVSMEGAVIHERGFALSRYLSRVREAIAKGKLVRHEVHGQRYWIRRHEVA